MDTRSTTLLVIGGGPGGYVAAIRAGQLGVPTTLVEGRALGGTCLNVGCIPSKALIHAAQVFAQAGRCAADGGALGIHVESPRIELAETMRWKDDVVARLTSGVAGLLKKSGVQVIEGWARVIDGKTVEVRRAGTGTAGERAPGGVDEQAASAGREDAQVLRIRCEHLLLAPGSRRVELPDLPYGGPVISSTEALSLASVPERLVVVGAGYIGLELGTAYRKLGARVAVVEALDRVLPVYDNALSAPVARSLQRLGIELRLRCKAAGLNASGTALRVIDAEGRESELLADKVLVSIGRRPNTRGWGLESLLLERNGEAIRVDEQCRTSMRNVWAIGDVTGEPMLAHRAMAQAQTVAEIVAGARRRFAPAVIPAVCFTDPEVVVVGQTPDQAGAAGADVVAASFPLAANGRAMTLDASEGFVRVVARREDHLIVGWQAVGAGVSELSTAFAHSIEMGARLEDVAATIHAHPTLGEAVQEAAMRALGRGLHA